VLSNIDRLAPFFNEWHGLFIENDSRDQTKVVLSEWARARPSVHVVNMDGVIAAPVRSLRLEHARNTCIELIRSDPQLRRCDYLVLMDMDDVNARGPARDAFERALSFLAQDPSHAAVFANQAGIYYDMWALRHPQLCPGDVWEEVCDLALSGGMTDQQAFEATFAKRIFSLAQDAEPLEVDSAFGGLGIYRMDGVLRNPNPYLGSKVKVITHAGRRHIARWQCCEHVHFHRGLRQMGGRLYVLPWLINADTRGVQFPASGFRALLS